MKLILLGPPGTGKGTQAQRIVKTQQIPQISTGDIFRSEIKNKTELGIKAKEIIDKGQLIPDDIVIAIVEKRLSEPDAKRGYILDGFPRTTAQAEALDKLGVKIDAVINIDSADEMVIQRITNRRTCKNCGAVYNRITNPPEEDGVCDKCDSFLIQRDDEKPETVKNRLVVYRKQTEPLIEYYTKKGILKNIDGNRSIDSVWQDAKKILNQLPK